MDEQAEEAIPAVVRMFSGCEDRQTSADGKWVVGGCARRDEARRREPSLSLCLPRCCCCCWIARPFSYFTFISLSPSLVLPLNSLQRRLVQAPRSSRQSGGSLIISLAQHDVRGSRQHGRRFVL